MYIDIDEIAEELTEMASIYAPSGKEKPMFNYLSEKLASYVDRIETDSLGNFIAYKDNGSDRTVAIDAHIDEIAKNNPDAQRYVPWREGYILGGKAMDDRAGVAVLVEVAKHLPDDVDANIIYLGACQEEVGLIGATHFVREHRNELDYAFIVDVTWHEPGAEMGKGPVLTLKDVPENYSLINKAEDTAKEMGMEYQISNYDYTYDSSTTDAKPYHLAGIDNAIISIPITNMHTRDPGNRPEEVDLRDIRDTAQLIIETLKHL